MTPRIPFVKASACGNDFLLIDSAVGPPDIAAFTRRICDRHEGVGADGVEWMSPHSSADVEIRLINADGSPAEISGNGTRCVAAYMCSTQGNERISILTGAGIKTCSLTARHDAEYEFEMEMGEAVVEPELALQVGASEVRGIPVSMGNPHFVLFMPGDRVAADPLVRPAPQSEAKGSAQPFPSDWQSRAAELQRNTHFAHGVNIEFVAIETRHNVSARFFERGAARLVCRGEFFLDAVG